MRMTKEDPGQSSGRGDRKDWFKEGGCLDSSEVERLSAKNC